MKLSVYLTLVTASLFAQPKNLQVTHGQASASLENSSFLKVEASDGAILNWNSFSIGEGETVQFLQPSEIARVLNRVVGVEKSDLLGTLLANGSVYLINPNGIVMGENCFIDVGSWTASCLDLSNEAFLKNEELLFEGESPASMLVQGRIEAKEGDILLLADSIKMNASCKAEKGNLLMGSGHKIYLGVEGKKGLYVDPKFPGQGIEILKPADARANPYSLGVNRSEAKDALQIEVKQGEIFLCVAGATLKNERTLEAKQVAVDLKEAHFENHGTIRAPGGTITVHSSSDTPSLSDQKVVTHTGSFDVSGDGGKIEIYTPKWESSGSLLAKGKEGTISLYVPGIYTEVENATLDASGEKGTIQILAGHLLSSGKMMAQGVEGGKIHIKAEKLSLLAAELNVSGTKKGGEILLTPVGLQKMATLNEHTKLLATGGLEGGRVDLELALPQIPRFQVDVSGKIPGQLTTVSPLKFSPGSPLFTLPDSTEPLLWKMVQEKEVWTEGGFSLDLTACPPTAIDLPNPSGTATATLFGDSPLLVLSNGNVVVLSYEDNTGGSLAGAAYLFQGSTGALLSTIRGSHANDRVGIAGTVEVGSSNFVVISSSWNGTGSALGAVTFASGSPSTGTLIVVDSSNSLVGTTNSDSVGSGGVVKLTNGNYVVASSGWDNPSTNTNVGAATFGSGSTGVVGSINPSTNSLVGDIASSSVSSNGIVALNNGNYVVLSPLWSDDGGTLHKGAATFGNGTTGTFGVVSSSNSIVGSAAEDQVGGAGAKALVSSDGNYVVASPSWSGGGSNGLGAVTFCSGTTATTGTLSSSNSLVGAASGDRIGTGPAGVAILALQNGNYAVGSVFWGAGPGGSTSVAKGAVTFGNGVTGTTGTVTAANSLVGAVAGDRVALPVNTGLVALSDETNGNYVVCSRFWNSSAGAATLCSGTSASPVGTISSSNSLIGSNGGDIVGSSSAIALTNGNYVVGSPAWTSGGNAVGAATFGNGQTGVTGAVSSSNSLIGSVDGDDVGLLLVALTNGNYAVLSRLWNSSVGAVTIGDGTNGTTGVVSTSNSFVGGQAGDAFGRAGTALSNGKIAVGSSTWQNASAVSVGAVTVIDGTPGTSGVATSANSVIGSSSGDSVGDQTFFEISSREFVFVAPSWNSSTGAAVILQSDTGAFCTGSYGEISSSNSLLGGQTSAGLSALSSTNIGDSFFVVHFTDYSMANEERVFSIIGTPASSTASILVSVPSRGLHNFASVLNEAFSTFALSPLNKPFIPYSICNLFFPPLIPETEETE